MPQPRQPRLSPRAPRRPPILRDTYELGAETLAAARALLDDAFDGEFTDDDWDHALGGVHALAYDGDGLIGHAAVVRRQFRLGGRGLRCGYVEAVAVHRDHRRRGVASALMRRLEPVIRGGYDLGALSATEAGAALYESLGWRRWEGPLRPEPDGIYVLGDVDVTAELTCDWRPGDLW